MDEKQARALLFANETGTNIATPPGMTEQAGRSQFGIPNPRSSFEERNYRGLPIDLTQGASGTTIVGAEFRDKPEQKIKYLEEIYGSGNVRSADDGTLLIKVVGSDNTAKEVPLSPRGLQMADVASMAAYIPETLAAITAMRMGRKLPFIGAAGAAEESGIGAKAVGFLRDVSTEAVGQEVGGTVKDVAVQAIDPGPINPVEVAGERAGRIPTDMAIGAGMGVAGKVLGKVITPFPASRGALEDDLLKAKSYFKSEYGVDFPLTAGERTGSSLLKRTEQVMEKLPGSSSEFADIRTEKTDRLRRIMNRISGLPEEVDAATRAALPSEEAVGELAVAEIRRQIDPVKAAAETSKNEAAKTMNSRILTELESASGTADRQLYPEKVGQSIRTKAFELRDKFQEQSSKLYQDAYSLPGGTERVLESKSLPGEAKRLLDALPSKELVTETASPIVGPYGEAITRTSTGREVLKEFVPPNVVGKLQTLSDLKGQKFSLQDLVRMRTDVANDIAQGEAIPGVQTHYLNKIRDTLTGAIEEATDNIPDGNLKAAWNQANQFYKENVGKFHEGPVSRLFKDVESRGFVSDENIIRNIGPTEYATFKKLLGPTSPEFTQVKRAIVDELLQSSTLPGESLVDGKLFLKQLNELYKTKRTIADDILGTSSGGKSRTLNDLAESLRRVSAGEEPMLDAASFRALLDSDKPLKDAMFDMVQKQNDLNAAYRSKIVKDISDRKLGDGFDASEFVNRFYSQASPKEMQSVISQLQDDPITLENLRRKVIEKVLYDAQRNIKDTDPSRLGRGELFRPSGAKDLDRVFGDAKNRERLQIALGNKTYEDLVNLGQLLRAGEVTEGAFGAAGGLSSGMQVAKMLRGGVLSYMEDWAKQKIAAVLLTTPGFRQWAGNTALSRADQVAMTRAFIASTPFVEAIDRDFSSERGTEEFINGINRSVGMYEKYGGNTGIVETPEQKADRMRKTLKEPAVRPVP